MPDLFDQVANSPSPTPSAAPAPKGDLFDQVAPSQPESASSASDLSPLASGPAPKAKPVASGDLFDQVGGKQATGSTVEAPSEDAWYNRPITAYAGIPETRPGAGPIERGAEKFGSALLSPLSLGLILVTGGIGGLAEGAGAEATGWGAKALAGLAPETAASVAKAAGTISKLATLGFTGQQIYGVAQAVPQVGDAIKAGDTDTALELGTQALLGGVLAGVSAKHLVGQFHGATEPVWTQDKEAIGAYQQPMKEYGVRAQQFEKVNSQLIKNKPLDVAAYLYHEAGGDPALLEKWRQSVIDDKEIKPALRQKYDQLLKNAQNLPDNVRELSDSLRPAYSEAWQQLQAAGKVHPDAEEPVNYAGQHQYLMDDEAGSDLKYVGKPTKSPKFLKSRTYDNIVQALHDGFEPKDVGLAAAHSDYLRRFGEMKGVEGAEAELQNQKADDARPLAVDPAKVKTIDGKQVIRIGPDEDISTFVRPESGQPEPYEYKPLEADQPANAKMYHGSADLADVANADPEYYNKVGTKYGVGLHLTDNPDVAESYSRTRAPGAPSRTNPIHPVQLNDAKLIDLEKPLTPEMTDVFKNSGIDLNPKDLGGTGKDVYGNLKAAIKKEGLTGEQAVDVYKKIATGLKQLGYDGLRHEGGDTPQGKQFGPHNAAVLFPDYGEGRPLNEVFSSAGEPHYASNEPNSKIISKDGKLYLDVSDYKQGPDQFKKFRVKAIDKNGDPVFEKANLMIHPDFLDPVNRAFDDTSWFRKQPLLNGVLKLSTQAKKSLLSFSPFHWNTEWLRGVQMGLSPLEAMKPGELTPDRLAVTSKFGPTLLDTRARSLAAEGSADSSLIHKIPFFGHMLAGVEDKLFGDYIPRLKADAFDKVVAQLGRRHPNWTEDQVHFQGGKIVDAAFGGLNWKMLGRSMSEQDALRMVMLAPDFTGSQVLFAKYGLQPGGSVVNQSLARIALYNFGVARVLNMLTTGKPHLEHPFGVTSPDDKKVWSVRTMPEDIMHALTDPRGFAYNRLNPLLGRTGIEAVTGRDDKGKSVTAQQEIHDLIRNVLPIPAQNFIPGFGRTDETTTEGVMRAAGLAAQPNTTTAYKLAAQLASNHAESGPVDPAKMARHQQLQQMEDALRTGSIKPNVINDAVLNGNLSVKEARSVLKTVNETKGMDSNTAKLYMRSTRLPASELLKVWDTSTSQEKAVLAPLLIKKRQAYFKSIMTGMTPAERIADPTAAKLRAIFPSEPIF